MNTNYMSESVQNQEVGYVTKVRDFLIYLDGLPTVMINDLVQSDSSTSQDKGAGQARGFVSSLDEDSVEVLLLDDAVVKPGTMFRRLPNSLSISVGEYLIGRAINPLGVPIDGKGPLGITKTTKLADLEKVAPSIQMRQFIKNQFDTGVTLIDTLIPIGRGQRELVLGDARSGKTSFLIDLIVNQKDTGVICIYTSIGKPITDVRSLIDILKINQSLSHTIVIAASSTDTAPLIYLAPQTGLTVAEYFQQQGKDVLLILDDMGNHAKIYREIALLGSRAPGRESYPGDIFFAHAHLLERAGCFNPQAGSGTITALPVIELNLADFTTFIPTNLMAMTDGHILFRASYFSQGIRPAIDISLSVSRIGQQTQTKVQNLLSTRVKQVLAQASQLETISRFSAELPAQTQALLMQEQMIREILRQESLTKISKNIQVLMLGLTFTSFLKTKDLDFLKKHKQVLIEAFSTEAELKKLEAQALELDSDEELLDKLEEVAVVLEKITGGKGKYDTKTN